LAYANASQINKERKRRNDKPIHDIKELYDTCRDRDKFMTEVGKAVRAEKRLQKKTGLRETMGQFASRL